MRMPRVQVDERADLGVLFVHGIGEQRRGETLTQFGEPLLAWIDTWLRRERDAQHVVARPVAARLQPPLLDGTPPAHRMCWWVPAKASATTRRTGCSPRPGGARKVLPPRIGDFTACCSRAGLGRCCCICIK